MYDKYAKAVEKRITPAPPPGFYETTECGKCGKKMIRRYGPVKYSSIPPSREYQWWCMCGHRAFGGVEVVPTPDDDKILEMRWTKANEGNSP